MATMVVKDANDVDQTIEKPLAPSRAAASASRPVVLSTEDFALFTAILAKLSGTLVVASASIANGASLSGAVDLATGRLVQIQMPAAWDAAALTFQTSADGVTYADLYDVTGAEYTVPAAASQSVVIPRDDFIGTRYLKIRSGLAAAAVNQSAARAITLALV